MVADQRHPTAEYVLVRTLNSQTDLATKLSVGSVLRNQVLKLRYQKRDVRLAKLKSHAKVGTERTNSNNPVCFLNFGLPHRQTNSVSRNVSSLRPGELDVGESREVLDGEGSNRRQFLGLGHVRVNG